MTDGTTEGIGATAVTRTYRDGGREVSALRDVTLSIPAVIANPFEQGACQPARFRMKLVDCALTAPGERPRGDMDAVFHRD